MTTVKVVMDPIPVPAILEHLLWRGPPGAPGTRPLDRCASWLTSSWRVGAYRAADNVAG